MTLCTCIGPPALRGNVLAAGGFGNIYLATAEVYDSTMGNWTATASLSAARTSLQMVLLSNGHILAAGGAINYISYDTAEVFDTMMGTWNATASLGTARFRFRMVLLTNGNVLAAGGSGGNPNGNPFTLNSAEVYNPTTGNWNATGSLAIGRFYFEMLLLPNGNVLVAGGSNSGGLADGSFQNSTEIYNSTTGIWSVTGSLATAREYFQMVLLPNGNVLVAGGYNGQSLDSAEVYNTTMGIWAATGSFTESRYNFQMVLLPNGNVLAAGGAIIPGPSDLTSSEEYNFTTGTWTLTGPLATPRSDFQMVLLPNGNVLAAGGFSSFSSIASAEVYNFTTRAWTTTGSLSEPRGEFQMVGY